MEKSNLLRAPIALVVLAIFMFLFSYDWRIFIVLGILVGPFYVICLLIYLIKKAKEHDFFNKAKRILLKIGGVLIVTIMSIAFAYMCFQECSSVLIYEEYENHIPSRYR